MPETHDCQLYLTLNDIERTRTKTNHQQPIVCVSPFIRRSCKSSVR
jgi:hypothetical protein